MYKKIHFVGVGGSGISGVYAISEKLGYEVSGCDIESESSYAKKFLVGHSPDHLDGVDLVVTSPSLLFSDKENSEIKEAKKREILLTWQEFIGKYLQKDKTVICIAGTHGKSTTTAMVGKLLTDSGLDPMVILGAKVSEWNGNYRFGRGQYLVIEADEFNDNYLNYNPEIIILNNIEFDHPDYFKSEGQVFESFSVFINNLKGRKILIANIDSPGVKEILKTVDTEKINLIEYSPSTNNQDIKLKVPGKHNIANSLGVLALGGVLGLSNDKIKESLENFSGIGRRMEIIKRMDGIEIYDDYAHHPTAIAATLEALRLVHPKARIWAIDEPHGYARTKALLSNYKDVFIDADKVIIGPIFKARDRKDPDITPELVAEKSGHKDVISFNSFNEIKSFLKENLQEGDVVIVMGAGKSYTWAREIARLIK